MLRLVLQLAVTDEAFNRSVKQATEGWRFNPRDLLIALSVSVALGFALFIWAYLRFRKQPDLMDRSNVVRDKSSAATNSASSSSGERRKRRRKRRRRDHRPRNPSLQQTGGLPPPRSDDDLPKF